MTDIIQISDGVWAKVENINTVGTKKYNFDENTQEMSNKFEAQANQLSGQGMKALKKVISNIAEEMADNWVEMNKKMKAKGASIEFGISFGGDVGVPFIANASTEASLNVKIEWEFEKQK